MQNFKTMKRITYILIIALGFYGCSEDFLDRSSLTSIAENNFWNNEQDAQLAINGIYAQFQGSNLYGGNLNSTTAFPLFDTMGDNAYNQFEFEGGARYMEGVMNPTDGFFNGKWTGLYSGIGRANVAIEEIGEMTEEQISESKKNELVAQARLLRALAYFNLAVYYEDVPLITEYQTLAEAYVPKNTYEEVTAQIVEDLQFAIANLPDSYSDDLYGYATKGAALGLLARVQLYNKVYDGEFGVLELTNQLLSLGYSLHPNYGELFTEAGEQSAEIVFSIRFLRGPEANNGETFSATFLGTPKVSSRPMPNMVNDYYCIDGLPITESPLYNPNDKGANRDPRANASVYFAGDIFLTDLNRVFPGNGPTGFGQRKYVRRSADAEGNAVFAQGSQDFYVIRYADVLLMRAEALVETGDVNGAAQLVNQVRARVGMPSIEDVEGNNLSQEQMRTIVRHERRVELAFEGLRFMDLKRWGTMEEAFLRAAADPVGPYTPIYQGRRSETFPIPQNELDVNKNLVQNPAWN
jgi:hypothetical protein